MANKLLKITLMKGVKATAYINIAQAFLGLSLYFGLIGQV